MKKIIYLSMFCIFISCVSAYDFTYNISKSDLPYYTVSSITLNGDNNLSINIDYPEIAVGVASLTFNTTPYNLSFYVNVPISFAIGNYSYNVIIYDTLGIYNYSKIISLLLIINDNETHKTSDYVQIDINNFEFNVCDNLQPYYTSHLVSLGGILNQSVNLYYDQSIFDIPNYLIFNTTTYAFNISILLNNLSIGDNYRYIIFNYSNSLNTSYIKYNFKINNCPTPFKNYIECLNDMEISRAKISNSSTPEETLEYILKRKECEALLYDILLNASERKIITNYSIEYQNFTDYVPVLTLDDQRLIDALKQLPDAINLLSTTNTLITSKQGQIDTLTTEKNDLLNTINTKVQEAVTALVNEQNKRNEEYNRLKSSTIKRVYVYWAIGISILISLGVMSYIYHEENVYY